MSINHWSERVDSDPALKRRVALWAVGGIVVAFALGIGCWALFSGSNDAEPKATKEPVQQARSYTSKKTSDSDAGAAIVSVIVVIGVVVVVVLLIWMFLNQKEDPPIYGLDEYGHLVRLNPRRDHSLLYLLLFFWLIDDD